MLPEPVLTRYNNLSLMREIAQGMASSTTPTSSVRSLNWNQRRLSFAGSTVLGVSGMPAFYQNGRIVGRILERITDRELRNQFD